MRAGLSQSADINRRGQQGSPTSKLRIGEAATIHSMLQRISSLQLLHPSL
jgi:hypothetical protein